MQGNPEKHLRLSLVQVRNVYYLYLTFSFSRRGERHNFYYADCFYIVLQSTPHLNSRSRVRISTHWPNKRAAYPVAPNGLSSPSLKNQLASPRDKSQVASLLKKKITKIPSPSLPCMTSFTPQSHFSYLGFLITTFVIVTSSARKRELHSMCAPARALSRIVLSLTKPNDKI